MRLFETLFLSHIFSDSSQTLNFAAKFKKSMRRIICSLLLALTLTACHQSDVLERLESIKAEGDTAPEKALLMADSLRFSIMQESEYAQKKYELLCVRLNDKAYKEATSDLTIRDLIPYFEENGTDAEKQEAYYYAGSVYRDLKDTPRALEYFLKSSETADRIDSVIRRNTYSQLYLLYFKTQDFKNALLFAKKEYQIAKDIGDLDESALYHLAACYLALDSIPQSMKYCNEAYKHVYNIKQQLINTEIITCLLYTYIRCNNKEMAEKVFNLLAQENNKKRTNLEYQTIGEYHLSKNKINEAIACYESVLKNKSTEADRYDAYRLLSYIYYQLGDYAKLAEYAIKFIQISDSLNLGKRQEEAATVNNMYQYHRDKEREQRLQDEVRQYRTKMYWAAFTCVFFLLLFWMQYNRKRSQHLKQLLKEAEKLQNAKDENNSLEQELEQANEALNNNKEKLKQAQEELAQTDQDLKAVTLQLREKLQQNAILKEFYQQNKLSINAKEVLKNIRKAAIGQHKLTPEEWDEFYVAVDELYPTFQDELLNSYGTYNAKQMRVFYLLRIGLTCPEIQNLADASRSTVYRWAEDYSKVIKENITTGNEQPEANTDI